MSNVWPFPPQRQLKERTEWKTDVLRARSAEQRICLRNAPRTSIEYDFQLLPQEIEAATVMSREWGADEFLLPFWHELEHVGTVSSGASSIAVDTTMRRYKPGGAAFIMGSDGSYEVVTIASITSSTLELADPFVVFGYAGAVVMPCFPARVKKPFKFRKYSADYFTSESEFILTEDFELTATNPYPAFNGSYVLTDRPVMAGSPSEEHTREFEGFPNLAGPLFYSKTYTYAVGTSTIAWSFDMLAQVWSFRLWMEHVKGKQGSFYMPRWTRDFVMVADALSTDEFLIVKTNEYLSDSYVGPVCIALKDGSQIYAIVDSWVYFAAGQTQMNLTAPIGQAISFADVEMITRMPKMRFNSDNIEYDYGDAGVVDVRLPIMEVPE